MATTTDDEPEAFHIVKAITQTLHGCEILKWSIFCYYAYRIQNLLRAPDTLSFLRSYSHHTVLCMRRNHQLTTANLLFQCWWYAEHCGREVSHSQHFHWNGHMERQYHGNGGWDLMETHNNHRTISFLHALITVSRSNSNHTLQIVSAVV